MLKKSNLIDKNLYETYILSYKNLINAIFIIFQYSKNIEHRISTYKSFNRILNK